jgi:hypothetical protein
VREKLCRGHQHAGRTNAALCSAIVQEGFLQRMKATFECQPLHSLNVGAFGLQHRHKATVHQLVIHAHGAGSALALATALLGSGQM